MEVPLLDRLVGDGDTAKLPQTSETLGAGPAPSSRGCSAVINPVAR
jgi:hypothetical protein